MSSIDTNVNTLDSLGLLRQDAPKTYGSSELGQDAFLELMIAQMKNQDPLEPMENGEFMSQLAQFTTSSGVKDLQSSFSQLAASMQSYQALQASSLVGRSVLAPGGAAQFTQTGPVEGVIDLTSSTQQLVVGIYDGSGQLVRRIDMGTQAPGSLSFTWDGYSDDGRLMPAGVYGVKANALVDGNSVAMGTAVYAAVDSVNLGGANRGVQLNLAGLGTLDLAQVRQVK